MFEIALNSIKDVYLERLKEEILKLLREKGECSFEELSRNLEFKRIFIRKILSRMIREGIVVKRVDYTSKKELFKINVGKFKR